jgi:hemerythrin
MNWREELSTGIPLVDEQHKELFKQVDILLDRSQVSRVDSTLAFLENYVVEHFSTEEMMQNITKYPWRTEHKEMHDNFVKTFLDLKNEYYEGGGDMVFLMKMTKIALTWLNEHIGVHDRNFGTFFKNNWKNYEQFYPPKKE